MAKKGFKPVRRCGFWDVYLPGHGTQKSRKAEKKTFRRLRRRTEKVDASE